MSQRDDTVLETDLDVLFKDLVDDVAYEEGKEAFVLIVSDYCSDIIRVLSFAEDDCYAGDISGDERYAERSDDRVRYESDACLVRVRVFALNVFQSFEDLGSDCCCETGVQGLAKVFFVGDKGFQHAYTGRKITEFLYLYACGCIDGGKEVSRAGHDNGLVRTVFGDRVINRAFGKAGYRVGTAIDQIS